MSIRLTRGTSRSTGLGTPARTAAGSTGTPRGGDRPEGESVFENTTGVAAGGVALTVAQFHALLQEVQPNPPPAQAVAQAQGPSFAVTPGQVHANRYIDYTTSTGIKLWQEVTSPLPNKFSAEGQDANKFCKSLFERAEKSSWNSGQANITNI